jgi:four helix bundle protein
MKSSVELEYYLLLAHDLRFISQTHYEPLAKDVVEVKQMLTSLVQKLKAES